MPRQQAPRQPQQPERHRIGQPRPQVPRRPRPPRALHPAQLVAERAAQPLRQHHQPHHIVRHAHAVPLLRQPVCPAQSPRRSTAPGPRSLRPSGRRRAAEPCSPPAQTACRPPACRPPGCRPTSPRSCPPRPAAPPALRWSGPRTGTTPAPASGRPAPARTAADSPATPAHPHRWSPACRSSAASLSAAIDHIFAFGNRGSPQVRNRARTSGCSRRNPLRQLQPGVGLVARAEQQLDTPDSPDRRSASGSPRGPAPSRAAASARSPEAETPPAPAPRAACAVQNAPRRPAPSRNRWPTSPCRRVRRKTESAETNSSHLFSQRSLKRRARRLLPQLSSLEHSARDHRQIYLCLAALRRALARQPPRSSAAAALPAAGARCGTIAGRGTGTSPAPGCCCCIRASISVRT